MFIIVKIFRGVDRTPWIISQVRSAAVGPKHSLTVSPENKAAYQLQLHFRDMTDVTGLARRAKHLALNSFIMA